MLDPSVFLDNQSPELELTSCQRAADGGTSLCRPVEPKDSASAKPDAANGFCSSVKLPQPVLPWEERTDTTESESLGGQLVPEAGSLGSVWETALVGTVPGSSAQAREAFFYP